VFGPPRGYTRVEPLRNTVSVRMVAAPMANLDPQAVLTKWKANTSGASGRYVEGAETTTKDPTALAIAAIPYMRSQILDAIDSGRVANGLRLSGKTGWLAGITGKGKQNFETGVANADTAFLNGFTPLLQFIGTKLPALYAMPNASKADRKARMNSWFDTMSGYKATR
jgi:hypothetical protein